MSPAEPSSVAPDVLPFGRLGRPHGVHGEIALRPFNPDGDVLDGVELPFPVLLVRKPDKPDRRELKLLSVRPANEVLLVRFEGIDSREQAAALTNAEIWLPRTALPELDDGEFYVEDLIGCAVVDLEGRERGTVRATFWNGAQDVLNVEGPEGELLVPAVPEFIREVDLDARRMVVDFHE
jgi:16S rRNA processing protein RimM